MPPALAPYRKRQTTRLSETGGMHGHAEYVRKTEREKKTREISDAGRKVFTAAMPCLSPHLAMTKTGLPIFTGIPVPESGHPAGKTSPPAGRKTHVTY